MVFRIHHFQKPKKGHIARVDFAVALLGWGYSGGDLVNPKKSQDLP
jgi:hypothetical protein